MDSLSLGLSALDGLPWDALYEDDALGGGSSGGGGGGRGSGGATAAHEAARSGGGAALEAPKCVDSTHALGCRRCVPAPPPALARQYELVGDVGKKNGEKKLRSQLCRTPEWCSSAAREAAAAQLAAAEPALAAALRARQCARLSKRDMIALLAHWRYCSDLWRQRGNRPARPLPGAPHADADGDGDASADSFTHGAPVAAARTRASRSAAGAAAAPVPAAAEPGFSGSGPLAPSEVWRFIGAVLRPLSAESLRTLAGPAARDVAEADADAARVYALELSGLRMAEAHAAQWMPMLARMGGALRAHEHELKAAEAEGATPAALAVLPPAVASVACLLQKGLADKRGMAARAAARAAAPGLSRPEAVWLREYAASTAASAQLMSQADALLARCFLGSAAAYASACTMVLDLFVAHSVACITAFQQRSAWVAELAARAGWDEAAEASRAHVAGRTPLFELPQPICDGAIGMLGHASACVAAMPTETAVAH